MSKDIFADFHVNIKIEVLVMGVNIEGYNFAVFKIINSIKWIYLQTSHSHTTANPVI